MPNYANTKIYKIVHKDPSVDSENVYVGSTVLKLYNRMAVHRGDARNGKMNNVARWLFDIDPVNASIVLLENYPCASDEEKRMRERYWVERLNPNLNMVRPYRTKEEADQQTRESHARNIDNKRAADRAYYAENAEKLKAYQKQYREDNAEKVSVRMKAYRERDPEETKRKKREEYLRNKATYQAYRERNKELLAAKQKEYYEKNADEIRRKSREYHENNRDACLARMKRRQLAKKSTQNI